MSIQYCEKCNNEIRLWHGYCNKEGKPLCNSCVLEILGEPTTRKNEITNDK